MINVTPNQCAAANRRPAGQWGGSGNLSAILAADRAFPAAVAEIGRQAAMSTLKPLSRHARLTAFLVVLLVAGFGCGPSEWGLQIRHWEEDTKNSHKAADVQAALAPFFSDGNRLTNQLPRKITALPIFSGDPSNIDVGRCDSSNVLMLTIGGGFGHWGLLVARPGHDAEISEWHRERIKPWDDGVYFFSEYKD